LALLVPLGAVGCGSSDDEHIVKSKVKSGNMPAEGSWRGVWYSQLYGYLHLLKDGDKVHGKWRTTAGDKWGEMHGSVEGDLYRYEWEENRIGMFGPNAKAHGKGYFKYVVPDHENADHEIHGEWGLDESDAGNEWKAIKQRRMEPDPNSVMPDETQTAVEGGDWDGTSGGGGDSKDSSGGDSDSGESDSWD
jgi:hypothetical protein